MSLYKRVRTAHGLRYCPAVYASNGRVRQDVVMVDEKEERHREGSYYITWYQGTKSVRASVGSNSTDAEGKRLRKQAELNAVNRGVIRPSQEERDDERQERSLATAVIKYLEETRLSKKPKTLQAYTTALNYFVQSCHKLNLEDIERGDLIKFAADLRDEKELSPRTCWNKFSNVVGFLKAYGVRGLTRRGDWPSYVEEEPEIYEREEIEKLFKACDEHELVWFSFFLMTGMREQEVMHCYWKDVNLSAGTVKVSHKPDLNWTPKMYKEREIPIAGKLVELLKSYRRTAKKSCPLLFPTSGCKPKMNFLDDLKAVAERAGMDPENCWLHKFRATFASWSLWAGIDLRTVQLWLGHTDLASTMRYLKPARDPGVKTKVNAVFY